MVDSTAEAAMIYAGDAATRRSWKIWTRYVGDRSSALGWVGTPGSPSTTKAPLSGAFRHCLTAHTHPWRFQQDQRPERQELWRGWRSATVSSELFSASIYPKRSVLVCGVTASSLLPTAAPHAESKVVCALCVHVSVLTPLPWPRCSSSLGTWGRVEVALDRTWRNLR